MDRHPGRPAARGRDGQAAADGGRTRQAGRRATQGSAGRLRRGPAQPGRRGRPQPADRLVPVPRPDRCGQDRVGQGAGRLPVRRRAGDGPHRHERVRREALRRPPGRCPSRLHRLRPGRSADRGGPPPAVHGGAVRRGREGPPGRVRRAAAGPRRGQADRRSGPHGGFPQHHPHPDVQPGLGWHRGAGDGGGPVGLQAGVHQSSGRRSDLRGPQARGVGRDRRHPVGAAEEAALPASPGT